MTHICITKRTNHGENEAAKGSHAVGKQRPHESWRRRLARYSRKRAQDALADMVESGMVLDREQGRMRVYGLDRGAWSGFLVGSRWELPVLPEWRRFPKDRRVLWQKVGPRLVSPVRSRHHVVLNGASSVSHLLRSGISALADLSMLATPPEDVYAVHSPRFRELIDAAVLKQMPAAVENSAVVERWKYDPVPLSAEGKRVDMLSLALSLRDNHDERVQGALDELLKDLPW